MPKYKISAVVILIGILLPGFLSADHRDYLFTNGNRAYQAGDYQAAVQAYLEILATGYTSAALYYNLANAYFKAGDNARAILNYERAARLKPADEDTLFNLQVARLAVVDKIPELPELFWEKAIRSFRSRFSLDSLAVIILLLYFAFFGGLILLLLFRRKTMRRIVIPFMTLLGLVLLVFTFTFVSKALAQTRDAEAVITADQVDARSAPAENGTVIFTIHAGLKVKLIQHRGDWQEIRLPDGKQGWLPADTWEKI